MNDKLERALDTAFGREAPPAIPRHAWPGSVADRANRAHGSMPITSSPTAEAPVLESSLQARLTRDAHREMRAGNTAGKRIFFWDDVTERWEQVHADNEVPIPAGKKCYIMTDADLASLLSVARAPDVVDDDGMKTVNCYLLLRNAVMENPHLDNAKKDYVLRMLKTACGTAANNSELMGMLAGLATTADPDGFLHGMEIESDVITALGRGPLVMQKPTGSVFHKAQEAFATKTMHIPLARDDDRDLSTMMRGALSAPHHIFVLEHNWSGAFANAKDFDGGEIGLPYDCCAFEFQFSDRRVVVSLSKCPEGSVDLLRYGVEIAAIVCIQTPHGWCMPGCFAFDNGIFRVPSGHAYKDQMEQHIMTIVLKLLLHEIGSQIRAVLISLEAEVATTSVVRAPYKLNAQREKRGKLPLLDYHVVSLAHRSRPERLPLGAHEPAWRVRCHFRRGHWRHYQNHKTWINWMLVGDPDLGFIDKEYRL